MIKSIKYQSEYILIFENRISSLCYLFSTIHHLMIAADNIYSNLALTDLFKRNN